MMLGSLTKRDFAILFGFYAVVVSLIIAGLAWLTWTSFGVAGFGVILVFCTAWYFAYRLFLRWL